eukprot:scaffold1931_cov390-Prasinococcus_capsulatus_cf.AAC.6
MRDSSSLYRSSELNTHSRSLVYPGAGQREGKARPSVPPAAAYPTKRARATTARRAHRAATFYVLVRFTVDAATQ